MGIFLTLRKSVMLKMKVGILLIFLLGGTSNSLLALGTDVHKSDVVKSTNDRKVSGIIKDETGFGVIGASIRVEGGTQGTISDVDGNFSIEVPDNATLIISFVGYKTQKVSVAGKDFFNIILVEDLAMLETVIVVGYGSQKKENLTGAVASVAGEKLDMRPVTNVASALQGVAPGVNINPSSGNPNSSPDINIRGYTSTTDAKPLVLVDGVEMDMSLVNPQDIESISVLKDASSSAIYGVRGAFGVVLITTKKGSAGTGERLKINYSTNFSWGKPTEFPEMVDNSYDHALFINKAMEKQNLAPMYNERQLNAIEAYYKDPKNSPEYGIYDGKYEYYGYHNWIDMMLKSYRPKQTHNFSVSGGSGKTTFYASYAYTRDEGYFEINPDIYRRNNFRVAIENRTYDWLKLGISTSYGARKYDEPFNYKNNSWQQVIFTSPTRPYMWDGDPNYPEYDKYIGMHFDDQNPVSLQTLGGRQVLRKNELTITPSVDITPLKNWNIHVDFSYQKYNDNGEYHRKEVNMIKNNFTPTLGDTSAGYFRETNSYKNYYSFNAYTDYEMTLKDKHYFKGMIGFNQELTTYKSNESTAYGLVSEDFPNTQWANGDRKTGASGYEWALRGGFARLNYIYDQKYLFEFSGRYDGTSRFPKDDRFTFLPSFSLGWRLSEEKFMNFAKPLFDNIKVRMSYGKLGNQMMAMLKDNVKDSYLYIPFLSSGLSDYYLFGGDPNQLYISPSALIPRSLTWEKAATINGGLDVTMLNSRLDLTFDIYRRTTTDMLYRRTYPSTLGESAPYENGGESQTTGWELGVNWRDRIGSDFSYQVGFALYDATAKITKWPGDVSTVDNLYKGKKIGEIWGYVCEGIIQDEETLANIETPNWGSQWGIGDLYFKDLDGKSGISAGANLPGDSGDKKVIGNNTPRYNYSVTLGADYKGIFFNAFFQGVGKRDYLTVAQAFQPVGTQYYITQKWHISDSWSETNRNAYFPVPRARSTQNFQNNSRFVQDASYMRLKNLTVGYNLPKNWLSVVKLDNVKVYFSGENLFEIDHIKGPIDPEGVANGGGNYYPFTRSYSFGLDITF